MTERCIGLRARAQAKIRSRAEAAGAREQIQEMTCELYVSQTQIHCGKSPVSPPFAGVLSGFSLGEIGKFLCFDREMWRLRVGDHAQVTGNYTPPPRAIERPQVGHHAQVTGNYTGLPKAPR
jgi:hypothetical protein